ncbi:hypothetical protein [Gordonia hirsuta]|nr:hypothetical protein [Gordonia hirsuta]
MTTSVPVSSLLIGCVCVEVMQGLVVLIFPFLLMLFVLAMERVQVNLDRLSVGRAQVDEFLESADDTDVSNLARSGLPAALDQLRRRRKQESDDEED